MSVGERWEYLFKIPNNVTQHSKAELCLDRKGSPIDGYQVTRLGPPLQTLSPHAPHESNLVENPFSKIPS
jgi:hypothetical protein